MALLEERKSKLAAEGLFDEARKQLLPFLPEVIGVVTSPTGAVIRDILHRLADRFPRHVIVWPVKVQGDGSAEQVAAAIRGFNALPEGGRIPRPDLLIVARGGGSLEDLWSFNEEIVVRAAADSMIPLISAVGHETDVTLIDFASDQRAPTPTAAAEMAVPVRADSDRRSMSKARRALACWQRAQEHRRTELRAAVARAADRRGAAGDPAPAARCLRRAPAAGAARQRADPSHAILPHRRAACRRSCCAAHVERRRAAARRLHAPARHRAQDLPGDADHAHRARAATASRHWASAASARCSTLLDNRDARLERAGQLLRRVLLSGRAVARLRAGSRRQRPSAALRQRRAARHGARHRVCRRPRRRDGAKRAQRPNLSRRRMRHPPRSKPASKRRRRSRPGKPVRVSAAGRTAPEAATCSAIRAG